MTCVFSPERDFNDQLIVSVQRSNQIKSNQIKSLLLYITTASALVSEILRACSKHCKKTKQFTYRQYIFTDCTEDNVHNTHTHTQYTQCTTKTVLVTNTLYVHILHYVHIYT